MSSDSTRLGYSDFFCLDLGHECHCVVVDHLVVSPHQLIQPHILGAGDKLLPECNYLEDIHTVMDVRQKLAHFQESLLTHEKCIQLMGDRQRLQLVDGRNAVLKSQHDYIPPLEIPLSVQKDSGL